MTKLIVIAKTRPGKKKELLLLLNGFRASQGLISSLSKQPGCLACNFHIKGQQRNIFVIESEWQSWAKVEAHLKSDQFNILVGAVRVLCEQPEIQAFDGERTQEIGIIPTLTQDF